MNCFVDTSGLYAVLDRTDAHHKQAKNVWTELCRDRANLVTTNYVLVETLALVQNRLGMDAVRVFHEDICPVLSVQWAGEEVHREGMNGMLDARRRELSLVDCVSFAVMRRMGIKDVFAFDRHFEEQGFVCHPSG